MKTTLTILSFLLLTLAATSFPGAVDAQDFEESAVVDIFGNKVLKNTNYIIHAVPFGNISNAVATLEGGRVVFSPCAKTAYPAVMSSPFDSNNSPVLLDTLLNFKMDYDSPPNNISTYWGVFFDAWMRGVTVTLGGDESYYFKIAKFEGFENVYKLVYCPTGRAFCQCTCVEVGCFPWGSVVYHLTPNSGQPLPITFEPVLAPHISPIV